MSSSKEFFRADPYAQRSQIRPPPLTTDNGHPPIMKSPSSIWKEAENAVVAGDLVTLERLLREHEPLFREQRPQSSWLGGLAPDYSGAYARRILAREHHFGSFDELAEHLEALQRIDSPVARFEAAADAVIAGDLIALDPLLQQNPELIHTRSARQHRA